MSDPLSAAIRSELLENSDYLFFSQFGILIGGPSRASSPDRFTGQQSRLCLWLRGTKERDSDPPREGLAAIVKIISELLQAINLVIIERP